MMKQFILKKFSIFCLIIIFINVPAFKVYGRDINLHTNALIKYTIVVDLNDCKLFLVKTDTEQIVKTYTIAGGKPSTPSPIGTWKIIDKGTWTKGFGTRWMGLNVPWGKYGIHGTNKPFSIGGSTSQGCIRMFNKDVEELYNMIGYGTTVIIYGGPYCLLNNTPRTLVPGNTGADVYEVQKRLKYMGYYEYGLDGIYGENMRRSILKFKKDNKLEITNDINSSCYKLLKIEPFE